MLLAIRHETRHRLEQRPGQRIHQLKLTPRKEGGQKVAHWQILTPGEMRVRSDAHGNLTHILTLDEPDAEMLVRVEGLVETLDEPAVLPETGLPNTIYLAETALTQATPDLVGFARDCLNIEPDPVYGLFDLMAAVQRQVTYLPCIRYAGGTGAEAFKLGVGACQDLAHVFITACRSLGIPARFASGYLQDGPAQPAVSHAWVEAWVTDLGWIGFDVSHNRTAGGNLCKLAVGRDYLEACPVRNLDHASGQTASPPMLQMAMAQQ